MKKLIYLLTIISVLALLFPSCGPQRSTTRKINVVQDEDTKTRDELSGDWNEADLRDSARTLINQMLNEPWYAKALEKKGSIPNIKIGKIKNKTDSHLPINAFIDSMQRTLINSERVNFVGDVSETKYIRKEQDEQMLHASDDTVHEAGEEKGADYMVFGQFTSMYDRLGGKEIRFLQVNLKLIDVETNRIVWVGEKRIKKFIQQKRRTW